MSNCNCEDLTFLRWQEKERAGACAKALAHMALGLALAGLAASQEDKYWEGYNKGLDWGAEHFSYY